MKEVKKSVVGINCILEKSAIEQYHNELQHYKENEHVFRGLIYVFIFDV